VARYDKYEPYGGGFRAPLAVNWLEADLNTVIAVSLNASGQVVKGTAGQSGFVGVLVLTKARKATEIVDVMTDGEIVDFDKVGKPSVAFASTAGTKYYAAAGGAVGTTNTDPYVGVTVEASRLVVRVAR
jgi:hypothetical protein